MVGVSLRSFLGCGLSVSDAVLTVVSQVLRIGSRVCAILAVRDVKQLDQRARLLLELLKDFSDLSDLDWA